MPRYVVTSDWHIQNTGKFSKPLEGGLTTRAEYSFEFIEWLWEYCEENAIEKILHCGDFFTQRGMISAPLYNKFYDLLSACPVPMIMIVGNHDRYKTDPSIHGMYVLADALDNITILDNQWTMDKHIQIAGVPPPFNLDTAALCMKVSNRKPSVLLIHENIIGASFSSGKKADDGVSLKRLIDWMCDVGFDICFCGDIHVPQEMTASDPPVIVVGAPFQMDFGDRDQARGIWVYDSDKNIVEFVSYEKGPKFYQITDETWQEFASTTQIRKPTDFYQFKVKSLELFREIGTLKKNWPNSEVQLVADDSGNEEFSVDNLYDTQEIVPKYVRNQVEEIPQQIPLINRGLNYIEKALKEKGEQHGTARGC
jgi:DNA repair exonuclease SbcCD nuclease subunit